MAGWFDRLKRSAGGDGLAARLRDYPPCPLPHAGPPSGWTLVQAQANLDALMQQRPQRLQALTALLAHEGIDAAPALAGADPHALLDALHHWANERWPALFDAAIASRERWLRSHRSGPEIVYSMLLDIALLLGELICARHPAYRWALDLDAVNAADGMRSALRPVLLLSAQGAMPAPVVLDLEDIVVGRYLHPQDVTDRLLNEWATLVGDAVAGRHEAPWLADSARPRADPS